MKDKSFKRKLQFKSADVCKFSRRGDGSLEPVCCYTQKNRPKETLWINNFYVYHLYIFTQSFARNTDIKYVSKCFLNLGCCIDTAQRHCMLVWLILAIVMWYVPWFIIQPDTEPVQRYCPEYIQTEAHRHNFITFSLENLIYFFLLDKLY